MSLGNISLTSPADNGASTSVSAPVTYARLALWTLLFQLAWNAQKLPALLREGAFPDPDDFLRLHQIRNWLNGQSWFDVSIARMNPPFGGDMHWSRLVDAPIALLIQFFDLFVATTTAERLAAIVWPTLLLIATVLIIAAICDRLIPDVNRLLALLFTVMCVPAMVEFAPGRLDHHNVQIFLFTLILLGLVNRYRKWGHALIGAAIAASAAVGIDAILLLTAVLAFLGIEWALGFDKRGHGLARTAIAMAASAIVLFFATVPPNDWWTPRSDAYSVLFLYALMLAATSFITLSLLTNTLPSSGRAAIILRFGIGLTAAGTSLFLLIGLFPESANGHFGGISAELSQRWLSQIVEAQSLPDMLARAPGHWVATVAYSFVLAAIGLIVILQRQGQGPERGHGITDSNRGNIIAIYAVMVLSILATIIQFRLLRIGIFASIPICVAFAAYSWQVVNCRWPQAQKKAAFVQTVIVVALLSPTWLVASLALTGEAEQAPTSVNTGAEIQSAQLATESKTMADWRNEPVYPICNKQSQYSFLAGLPKEKLINDLNSGPSALIFTGHAILAGNYHRNGAAILQTMDFFETTIAEAKKIAAKRRAKYIAYCDPGKTLTPTPADKQKLVWHILNGRLPPWLKRISPPTDRMIVLKIQPL